MVPFSEQLRREINFLNSPQSVFEIFLIKLAKPDLVGDSTHNFILLQDV